MQCSEQLMNNDARSMHQSAVAALAARSRAATPFSLYAYYTLLIALQ